MLNKIFITIILLCGFANASALDHVNKNLCKIVDHTYDVSIQCTPRANNFKVSKISLIVNKSLAHCNEYYVNTDGTYSTRLFKSNVTTFTEYDEFGVRLSEWSSKEDTEEACLFLYNAYKEAARRL